VFLKTGTWTEQKAFTVRERRATMNLVAPYSAWFLPAAQHLPPPAHPRAASESMYSFPALLSLELQGRKGSQGDHCSGQKEETVKVE